MGSVSEHFSGVASGVNNAITRVANVFANAILGALAVVFFSGALQTELKNVQLSGNTKQEVLHQSSNLGNAKPPKNIPRSEKQTIKKAYKQSFISAYGNVMRISALLAFTGALMALFFIRNSAVKQQTNRSSAE